MEAFLHNYFLRLPALEPILSQLNSVHTLTALNPFVSHHRMHRSSKWILLGVPTKML